MESKLEFPQSAILTPYNYFEWKSKIQLHLRSRGLFRITMETEVEPTSAVEKSRYFNRMDEAFGILCLSISPELLFHVESCSTPNEVWKILEELFGKQNEMLRMVEDSIAIYRNSRENFSLEPEDPHVASLYATNYVQGLQETDDGDPNQSEGTIRGTGCANVACTGNEPKKDNGAAMAASLATGSGQAQAMNLALTSMGSLNSPLQTLNPHLNPGLSSALNPALRNSLLGAAPPLHHSGPFPAFYDQHPQPPPQHSQRLYSQSRSDYEPVTRSVPLGVISWWFDDNPSDVLEILFLGDTSKAHRSGEFTDFYLMGGLNGLFNGFSKEFVSRAWDLTEDKLEHNHSNISGTVPEGMAALRNLESFLIWNNSFSGRFPERLRRDSTLVWLDVSTNNFTGPVPPDLCAQCVLFKLILFSHFSHNPLGGRLPDKIWSAPGLHVFSASFANLSGKLPAFTKWNSLQNLQLQGNALSDSIPRDIIHCQKLARLELGHNVITGLIPAQLVSIPKISATGNSRFVFNSGMMVIEPSNCTFRFLLRHRREIISYNGGDKGYLNEIFTWWHRIPRCMNYLKHFWSNDTEEYEMKTSFFGTDPPELYVLHYLEIKPWLCHAADLRHLEENMLRRSFTSCEIVPG